MRENGEHPFEDLFEWARDPAFILDPIADRIVAANRADASVVLMASAFGVGVVGARRALLRAVTIGSPYSVSKASRRPVLPRGN